MAPREAWCQSDGVKNKTWIVRVMLTVLFRLWEITTDTIFWLLYRNAKRTPLPEIDNLLLLDSATSLAAKIRNRKVLL